MKDEELNKLKITLVKDIRQGGFTSFFKGFPGIVSQGETEVVYVIHERLISFTTVHKIIIFKYKPSLN